jgi:hypothetical protein
MTHLSTRILKPSLHESFEEKYTASLEDIPVSRSVARESEKERKTQDTCGHTSEAMSGQLDLFGASLKMSEATPRWGYGESCPIWKKMVTERSGDCSARRKQARLTNASDASSWPTASARDWKDTPGMSKKSINKNGTKRSRVDQLARAVYAHGNEYHSQQIALEETAMNSDMNAVSADQNIKSVDAQAQLRTDMSTKRSMEKCTQGSNWPTPRAGNPGSRKPGTGGKILAEEAKNHAGPPAPEKSSTSGKNHGSPKLNPAWVCQLMGLPRGWTSLGSWGTESSHKPQN